MGLLDSLFNSDSYGGQGGGLLDFLRNAQMQNSQYQPTQNGLSPPPATFGDRFNALPNAPQTSPAPSQAQPIRVGGVQMPRLGNPDLYNPQQAMLPQNSQPTQGQLPTQPVQSDAQPMQLPPALGGGTQSSFLGRLGRPDSILGALTGNDARSISQQNLKAQYDATRQALIANGVPERQANSTAMLSVMNPEAAKTVLPELLTNKEKYQVISEDPLMGKQYGFVNDREQTINGKPLGQGGQVPGQQTGLQGLTDKLTEMRTQGATPEQMLGAIPTGYRDDVKSMGEGRAVPANLGRAQTRGPLLTLTKVVYPNFDEQTIPARIQMRKDFAGEGKNGQAIGAFNTVQHHADQVSDAISEFEKAGGGSDSPLWNASKLLLANNTSYDPKLRDAAQKLKDKLNATEHEVASAYNAGHLSDHDLKTWNEIKAENLPAGQLKQKLSDFVDLVNGKRDSLNHMYRTTFGEDAPAIDKEANSATTAKIHQRLPQYGGGQATAGNTISPGWTYKGSYKGSR